MGAFSRGWEAALLLTGTIIGVGMFGIPFVVREAGFLTGALLLAVLTAAILAVHLAYARIVLATPTVHRLPGYVRLYLGPLPGGVAALSNILGLAGALLAYVVLGGMFLGDIAHHFLPGVPAGAGPMIFFVLGFLILFRGLRFEGLVNAVLTLGLVGGVVALALALPHREAFGSLLTFGSFSVAAAYGVILFALDGAAVIPNMRVILGKATERLQPAVITGVLVPPALYLLFAAAVITATGAETTPDAVSGITARFGENFLLIGAAIGFLATITSFIGLGGVLEEMLVSDLRMNRRVALAGMAAAVLLAYVLGANDFLAIIGAVGALAIGLDSAFVLAVERRLPAPFRRLPSWLRLLLMFLFAVGAVLEIVHIIR
ncbi:MAG: hypothetical protein A3A44_01205 [Candidatus Sungbacteria bacterium RIFCSPLOWO2_01_FULL_60_25]|uniref:Amino acid transporter transmembrane domain-containing protein n=1 Tax=Candidatus Sungbacteria bacterium RIFCSPLOWO2_01_FULL_60_25 TaxID=1802281 RepID=A0A1G2LF08_9BACT|nr:MAG: hypothetical protein A3A44_01205 [Candidatus Sungbacteria bacterium RIFCSPLOWO2_01_FULL_60_25]